MQYAKKVYVFLICVLCSILAAGCGSLPVNKANNYQLQSTPLEKYPTKKAIIHKLYYQHKKWEGVRYQLGGLSKKGIDCSGFVHLTYKSKLGMYLPRTTRQQSRLGKEIYRHELKAGDLVFFRTGPTSKHVGIYIEKNKFLHVSQKKGVTISLLDNVYWKAKYWKSVRV
ncbi:NlpC/P60 family protein [Nitrosomonas sp.]|uniref:NlpC/P60 family protein n=1 Tax=Nitrosomonas sp. TaxID=42353 RepID=UPI0025F0B47F|nr:NlpC/P60 family protein [Nitrosomonas sp.]